MPILKVYIDEKTENLLRHAADYYGRTVEDLAESAVSEAAQDHARQFPRDHDKDLPTAEDVRGILSS